MQLLLALLFLTQVWILFYVYFLVALQLCFDLEARVHVASDQIT